MKACGVKHTTCSIDTFNSFYLVMLMNGTLYQGTQGYMCDWHTELDL
jgi:hypothetical protein